MYSDILTACNVAAFSSFDCFGILDFLWIIGGRKK